MPRPEPVEPTLEKLPPQYEEGAYRETHPSYGMIRAGRVSGGHSNLYGSSVSHQHFITIEISHGARDRHLSTDWYTTGESIVRVDLSANQFAEMLTNMNSSGVPCTLSYIDRKPMPACPERHIRQEVQDEFETQMRGLCEDALIAEQKMAELVKPGRSIKKSDIHDLQRSFAGAVASLRSSVPFAQECFNEACDKAATEAKAEVDAAFTHLIAKLGMESAKEKITELLEMDTAPRLPTISEGD